MAEDEADIPGAEGEELVAEEEFFPEAGAEIAGVRPELQKLYRQHPELIIDYKETVAAKLPLTSVLASATDVGDPRHRTYPFLTLYEKTKIIGLRANQLSQGSRPFISVPAYVTDVREIARLELDQKRLPFIIKRPLPNGKFEYWRLHDMIVL
jgi:DNA-directed RNA polymerase I, II, and III subunit RPABC2